MMKQNNGGFERIITLIVSLNEILKGLDTGDHTGKWLDFLIFNTPSNDTKQQEACRVINEIIRMISRQNRQVSSDLICRRVVELLQEAIAYSAESSDFLSSAQQEIIQLLEYQGEKVIRFPLEYLITKNEPVEFGMITVYNITEEDYAHNWWKNITNSGGDKERIRAYASVNVHGDLETSLQSGRNIVNDMLLYLRAIGFPFTIKRLHNFGLMNEYSSSLSLPLKIDKTKENFKLEHNPELTTFTGPGRFSYEMERDFLNKIDPSILEKLQRLIKEDYFKRPTEMKKKYFLGLQWLGEATKPDTTGAQFVKLTFSLEAFIGGEANLNNLSTKGITASLAERAAFIAGENAEERRTIHDSIFEFYGIRSGIVHGGAKEITNDDLNQFASLIRKIAWSLLDKMDTFTDINSVQEWVLNQRYTL